MEQLNDGKIINIDELQAELNEPTEMQSQNKGFFDDIDIDEDENQETEDYTEDPDENSADIADMEDIVLTYVDSFSFMMADLFSSFTGQNPERYLPAELQRKQLAGAIIKAFPRAEMSPGWALVFAIIMTYGPVSLKAFNDFKQKRNESKSINHTPWDERDRQNDFAQTTN